MKSTETTQNHSARNTFIAIALAAAIAVPVTAVAAGGQQALATNGNDTATTELVAGDTDATCEGCEYMSNEEYVASLVGLTDAERQELLALYDKWDALADDEDLTDAEWNRMFDLEDKAWYAEMEDQIRSDTTLSDDQRAAYMQQLKEMKELDAYFNAYFSDPTYLEMLDKYDAISESLGDYMGWNDCYDCSDCYDCDTDEGAKA